MAIQFGTKALIEVGKEIGKYGFGVVTGGGIVLASLLAWTGADDLDSIKTAVNQFEQVAEQQVSYLVGEYSQVVVDANAEIGEYKQALEQANDNITDLIRAYESKQTELTTKEQELKDLQEQLAKNYVSVDEVNQVIEKANEQIDTANQQVTSTRQEVQDKIIGSNIVQKTAEQRLADTEKELDVDEEGKPKATDIPSNIEIPTQKPTEQPQE